MSNSRQAKAKALKKQAAFEAKIARQRKQRTRTLVWSAAALGVILLVGAAVWFSARAGDEPRNSSVVPPSTVAEGRDWDVTIETTVGTIEATLHGESAPQAVSVLVTLIRQGFFDQTDCHRLTTSGIFVLQCGDPDGNGTGGPPYRFGPIEAAPADDLYRAGTIAMARQGGDGNSMGSQFFIAYADSTIPSDAAGGYSVVGEVTSGLEIITRVAESGTITGAIDGRPAQSVIITKVTTS